MLATYPTPTAADFLAKPIRVRSGLTHLTFSNDGTELATADAYMHVRIEKERQLILERDFNVYDDRIRSIQRLRGLRFSEDASRLFVAAADTLYSIDAGNGETLWSFCPPRSFAFLVVSPMGIAYRNGALAATFDDGSFGVWDESGALSQFWKHNDTPKSISFTHEDDILIGSDTFSITTWNWRLRKRLDRYQLRERAYTIAPSVLSDRCALWTLSQVQIVAPREKRLLMTLPTGLGLPVLAMNPKDDSLAVAERHGVRIYDVEGGETHFFPIDVRSILSMAFSPDGSQLAVGGSDSAYHLFSVSK